MKVLGIESSCDETAASVVEHGRALSNIVASQHEVHARFGGVVPELASRRHVEVIIPVIEQALAQAKTSWEEIDAIAVTSAPGLLGALLVGISVAKSLALARNLPLIGVNHLEAHLNAPFLEQPDFPHPYVGLVVSGGHTSLYHVKDFGDYHLLGATRDDAAGEAFDKAAILLGLGYPGGPRIDALSKQGNARAFRFTKPKFSDSNFDFSFSGYKTAVRLLYQKAEETGLVDEKFKADLAASFQQALVDFLTERLMSAAQMLGAKGVVLSGGVAANRTLREQVKLEAEKNNFRFVVPAMNLCTDNAAMIAYVGEQYLKRGKRSDFSLGATANQEIGL